MYSLFLMFAQQTAALAAMTSIMADKELDG
jgi:hypothetical protein